MTFDSKAVRLISRTEFSINLLTWNQSDRLNLKTLFLKFPDNKLNDHMKAITSFPQNIESLANRLFVYYLGNAISI